MKLLARIVAAMAGLVGLVVGAAAFVREVVLAAEPSTVWSPPRWWSGLAGQPAWQTGLAAGVCAVLSAVLVLLAVSHVRSRPSPGLVEHAGEGGRAQLDVAALEPALRRRLQADLSGVTVRRVMLHRSGDGWRARVEADVPLRDLLGIQRRTVAILTADLRRVGGLELNAVDIVAVGIKANGSVAGGIVPTRGT